MEQKRRDARSALKPWQREHSKLPQWMNQAPGAPPRHLLSACLPVWEKLKGILMGFFYILVLVRFFSQGCALSLQMDSGGRGRTEEPTAGVYSKTGAAGNSRTEPETISAFGSHQARPGWLISPVGVEGGEEAASSAGHELSLVITAANNFPSRSTTGDDGLGESGRK